MDQIKKYIIELTNLYGIVTIDKVVEIYNMQNEEQISFSDVEAHYYVDLSKYYVYAHKNHFYETIMEFNDFKPMLEKKRISRIMCPNQEELLNTQIRTTMKNQSSIMIYVNIQKTFLCRRR